MCRRKSSVVTHGVQISSEIAAGLAGHQGGELRQQRAGSPTRTQQGRVGEDGDGLSVICHYDGNSRLPGAPDVFAGRGMKFFEGDRAHGATVKRGGGGGKCNGVTSSTKAVFRT